MINWFYYCLLLLFSNYSAFVWEFLLLYTVKVQIEMLSSGVPDCRLHLPLLTYPMLRAQSNHHFQFSAVNLAISVLLLRILAPIPILFSS